MNFLYLGIIFPWDRFYAVKQYILHIDWACSSLYFPYLLNKCLKLFCIQWSLRAWSHSIIMICVHSWVGSLWFIFFVVWVSQRIQDNPSTLSSRKVNHLNKCIYSLNSNQWKYCFKIFYLKQFQLISCSDQICYTTLNHMKVQTPQQPYSCPT